MEIPAKTWPAAGLFLLLSLAVVGAYLPAMEGEFYLDDYPNIVDVPALQWSSLSLDNLRGLMNGRLSTRFVANLTFGLDYLRAGLDPHAYHRTNLLIHLLVGAAVAWVAFLLAREAHPRPADGGKLAVVSVVAAGFFLLHPLATQAVSYIVQRMTSLAALFSLLALGSYICGRQQALRSRASRRWFAVGFLSWFLALGSKEIAVAMPGILFLYELAFHRTDLAGLWRRVRRSRRNRVLFAILLGTLLFLGATALQRVGSSQIVGWTERFPNRDFSGYERVLTEARVQAFYATLVVWPAPSRLNIAHAIEPSRGVLSPPSTLAAMAGIVIFLAIASLLLFQHPQVGFPLASYALLHLLESGPINLELVFEHRNYLPLAMLAFLWVPLLSRLRWRALLVFGVILLCLGSATSLRNRVWRSNKALWLDVVEKSPHTVRAQTNLGNCYLLEGDDERALAHFRRAMEIEPRFVEAIYNAGIALERLGRLPEALRTYKKFVRRAFDNPDPQVRKRALETAARLGISLPEPSSPPP